MNIKRTYWQLLSASAFVGIFLANCTIKESNTDNSGGDSGTGAKTTGSSCTKGEHDVGCKCSGNLTGYQVCGSDGVYGACVCPAGSTAEGGDTSTAGATSGTAGTTSNTGGAGSTEGGAATAGTTTTYPAGAGGTGEAGAAGAGAIDPADCNACLQKECQTEWDACFADEQCISANIDGSGQYERISSCIETARVDGLVKRDAVRGCGVTIGASTDADLLAEWAPEGMSPNTTNLMNCLASAKGMANADWANDPANYPVVNDMVEPTPWPASSCAKLACTSKL